MREENVRVLIVVGGGGAGLTASMLLARQGLAQQVSFGSAARAGLECPESDPPSTVRRGACGGLMP